MIKIREIKAKSIIARSNLPDTKYTINPYVGYVHSCLYCYARFMKRFINYSEPWGKFIDVKINGPELISEGTIKYKGKQFICHPLPIPIILWKENISSLAGYWKSLFHYSPTWEYRLNPIWFCGI